MPLIETLAAGANIASTIANPILQAHQNLANRKFVQQQYKQQRADNIADRDYQNNYNSPTQQMRRLREAGLNPHLAIGGGNAGGTSAPTAQAQQNASQGQAPQVDVGYLSQFMDMRQRNATINLTEKQAENEAAIIQLNQAKFVSELTENEIKNLKLYGDSKLLPFQLQAAEQQVRQGDLNLRQGTFDLNMKEALKENTISLAIQNLANQKIDQLNKEMQTAKGYADIGMYKKQIEQINASIKNMSTDNQLKQTELNLLKEGVSPNSPTWQRVLIQQSKKYGITTETIKDKAIHKYEEQKQKVRNVYTRIDKTFNPDKYKRSNTLKR